MEVSGAAPRRYFFRKPDRLCARRLIEPLFKHGQAFNTYPLRFVWAVSGQSATGTGVSGESAAADGPLAPPLPAAPQQPAVQVLLSVSKRHYKRAHDRNRIKRLLREAWRLDGLPALQQPPPPVGHLSLAVLYIGREKPESLPFLRKKLLKGLTRLRAELPANRVPSPV